MLNKLDQKYKLWDDLQHFISRGFISTYTEAAPDSSNGVTHDVVYFLYRLVVYPVLQIFKRSTSLPGDLENIKTWLVFGSINNRKALKPFYVKKRSIFVSIKKDLIFRNIWVYKLMWVLPLIFYLYKTSRLKYFVYYYDVLGLYEESTRVLKKYRPHKLVFSNDHVPVQVALKLSAMQLGIETYYFQHGGITKYFPPLNFTASFLDGEDAYDKYLSIGKPKGKIELIGNMKSRHQNHIVNNSDRVKSIGIAINRNTGMADTISLAQTLKRRLETVKIIIRDHPADDRSIEGSTTYERSDPLAESTVTFLQSIDLLIATNSSIHLEAALQNVCSVYYKISPHSSHDTQGFVENGLIFYAESIDSLIELIRGQMMKKSDVIHRAAYYDEFINSSCNYEEILNNYGIPINPIYRQGRDNLKSKIKK